MSVLMTMRVSGDPKAVEATPPEVMQTIIDRAKEHGVISHHFYGTDDIAFTFVSDEFNGVTRDNSGNVRPLIPRSFSSLSEAEEENGQSRIYLGIHWAFDKTEGIAQGRRAADYVFKHAFVPRHRNKKD